MKAKKPAAKATPPKKAAPKVNTSALKEKLTKTQIVSLIAEETGLTRNEVKAVFTSARQLCDRSLKKGSAGEFTWPEAGFKLVRYRKKATKKRMGRNPATGEAVVIAAKPARDVLKGRILKNLKEVLG